MIIASEELSNKLVEKEKEIISKSEQLNIVEIELYNIKLEMAKLEQKKLETAQAFRQGRHTLTRLKSEKEILTREFWASKT